MVINLRSYGHLKNPYNPQQINDDRGIFLILSDDVRCEIFRNDRGLENIIAIKHIKWLIAGKEKLRRKRCR